MAVEVILKFEEVEQCIVELLFVRRGRTVADDDVLQVGHLLCDQFVVILVNAVALEVGEADVGLSFALEQSFHVVEKVLRFVVLVLGYFGHIVVEELEDEEADLVVGRAIDRIDKFTANAREHEVEEKVVAVA